MLVSAVSPEVHTWGQLITDDWVSDQGPSGDQGATEYGTVRVLGL